MKNILLIVPVLFFLQVTFVYSQDSLSINNAIEKEKEEIKFTNNEGIEREKIIISFDVKEIVFDHKKITMSKGDMPAIIMDIPETKADQVREGWSNLIRNKTKSKVETLNNEIYINGTVIEEISSEPINVYAQITENIHGTKVIAFFEIGDSFLSDSTDTNKYNGANIMMRNFGVNQYQDIVKEQVKIEKKLLEDLESDLDKYQKKNTRLHKQIKENEQDIINKESDIKMNLNDQDAKIEQISDQKRVVSKSSGDAKKEAEKVLKELEKDRKKLQDDHKGLNKDNTKSRGEIENLRIEIVKNLSEQDVIKDKISRKLSDLKSTEEKLANIK
ncbi:MAG: hypothetical protein OEW67_09900 [Cyclobacteriaceae bacterium]|nr:hypothetical protein [Cyclobacteriaceae bacterium]